MYAVRECHLTLRQKLATKEQTITLMKYLKTWDKSYKKKLEPPMVPTFMLSLIQRKRSPP